MDAGILAPLAASASHQGDMSLPVVLREPGRAGFTVKATRLGARLRIGLGTFACEKNRPLDAAPRSIPSMLEARTLPF